MGADKYRVPCSQDPVTEPYPEPLESYPFSINSRSILMFFSNSRFLLRSGMFL
jgi:hypothetical protein